MKCFEIAVNKGNSKARERLTVNMKCFEIGREVKSKKFLNELTVNMKCFEINIFSKVLEERID